MIKSGKIQKALVIGLEFFNKSTTEGFRAFKLLSKDNIYRPFDSKNSGIILGEACSALVLESERKSSCDFKYLGSANICDTYSETTSNPNGKSIFTCMHQSLQNANISLDKIDLIKAHGTGSENNTIAELNAFKLLFNKHSHHSKITSLKPYLGHTLGACGSKELALLIICLNDGFIPPMLGFSDKNSKFDFIKKRRKNKQKLNILLNHIGFGGNNTSIILSNHENI